MSRTIRRKNQTEITTRFRYYRYPCKRTNKGNWVHVKESNINAVMVGEQIVCWGIKGREEFGLEEIVEFHKTRFHMDNRSICDPWMKCYYRRRVRKHYKHETYLMATADKEFLTKSIYEHDGWWYW